MIGALLLGAAVAVATLGGVLWAMVAMALAAGGASALVAAVAGTFLTRITRLVDEQTSRTKGIAVIDALPPGEVLQRLLGRVLGEHEANEHIAQSLLGGEGRDVNGRDLSLAGPTNVHYELTAASPGKYDLTQTVEYTFPRPISDLTMSLFTTSDARLRDIIVAACDRPLFDWTYIGDTDEWRDSQDPTVELAITFLDERGRSHTTEMQTVTPYNVPTSDWPEHLSIFRHSVRSRPKQEPKEYIGSLRIHSIDLVALAPYGTHPVELCSLTLQQTSTHPDYGNTFWQAPFPCLLEQVVIDVTGIAAIDGVAREFAVTPFLTGTRLVEEPKNWTRAEEIPVLDVGTWVLPGHGFVVLWRPESDGIWSRG